MKETNVLVRVKYILACITVMLVVFGFVPFSNTGMMVNAMEKSIQEDTNESEDSPARHYVQMSSSGTDSLTLSESDINSFPKGIMIYDNGKGSDYYSNNSNSRLQIIAPEGYRIHVGGHTEIDTTDWMMIYDGLYNEDGDNTILADKMYTSNRLEVNVFSSGKSLTVHFCSDGSYQNYGLYLVVTFIKTSVVHDISVAAPAEGGSVTMNPNLTKASYGEKISLSAEPEQGYVFAGITLKNTNGEVIPFEDNCNFGNNSAWINNSAYFNMPDENVVVEPRFVKKLTADDGAYIKMLKTGNLSVNLSKEVNSFNVYDDGGKPYFVSNRNSWMGCYGCNDQSYLEITAPEGCILSVSGLIYLYTADRKDRCIIYDGDTNSEQLVNILGQKEEINVLSSGNKITIYFYSNPSRVDRGLDLKVSVYSEKNKITVDNESATGGTVVSDVDSAYSGSTITLSATPEEGYIFTGATVTDKNGNQLEVDENGSWGYNMATFIISDSDVTVVPKFTKDTSGLYVNMPRRDVNTLTVPGSVSSYKVYDDGGSEGTYLVDTTEGVEMIAPEGYYFHVTGEIDTYSGWDYLHAYDVTDTGYDQIYNQSGKQNVDIFSAGNRLRLTLVSGNYNANRAGVNLNVDVLRVSKKEIHVDNSGQGGKVSVDKEEAYVGETVTITAEPDKDYIFTGATVTTAGGENIEVSSEYSWSSNKASFKMASSPVTVTPHFENNYADSLSVNMPKEKEMAITIPDGVNSLKLYDDGGPDGACSYNSKGYATLTAPDGYRLLVTGKVSFHGDYSANLTVNDGDKNSYAIINNWYKTTDNMRFISSGNMLTFYLYNKAEKTVPGIDLTVTLIKDDERYQVTVNKTDNGSAVVNKTDAYPGETVTITGTAEKGYLFAGAKVLDKNGNPISVYDNGAWGINEATFVMPDTACAVNPLFIEETDGLSVNMPDCGEKTLNIPENTNSFMLYDDGGPDNNYSAYCRSTLNLVAPEGCRIVVTGSIDTIYYTDDLYIYDIGNSVSQRFYGKIDDFNFKSTGNALKFSFDPSSNKGSGFKLLVKVLRPVVVDDSIKNGKIRLWYDGIRYINNIYAEKGEEIEVEYEPDEDCELGSISYNDGEEDHVITPTEGRYVFDMPGKPVTVMAHFIKKLSNPTIIVAEIPIQEYTGSAIEPSVRVMDGDEDISDECEFEYSSNTEIGEASVTIKAKDTSKDYSGSTSISFMIVKAKPVITSLPKASDLESGKALSDSSLTSGVAKFGDEVVEGSFAWKDSTIIPAASDSEKTEYVVVFTPSDEEHFEAVSCKVKVKVIDQDNKEPSSQEKDPSQDNKDDKENKANKAAEKGTVLKDGKAEYVVTSSNMADPTVELKSVKSAKVKVFTVPATVSFDGVTYKVISIAPKAFKNKKKLTKVIIGANVEQIGNNAFVGCGKLKTVIIKTTKLKKIGKGAFKKAKKGVRIKCPKKQLKKYKKLLKKSGLPKKAKITK